MQAKIPQCTLESMMANPRRAIAMQDNDAKSLNVSASGGAFAVLARAVLSRGGAVFGAALLDDGAVCHVCVRSFDELFRLQGSKYVRSDTANTYKECAELLNANIEVLYSGTPCQVSGLRKYLDKATLPDKIASNLLCVDLICHGTPKQEVFNAYLEWLATEKKADDGIHGYIFRSKKMGWGLYYFYYYYRNGKRHEVAGPARDDPYYSAFIKGVIYRKCCYKCPYARIERVGDITIGDYWGVDSVCPGFSDGRGVSAVLLNTEKGERFFDERCAEECRWVATDVKDVATHNANLVSPTARSSEDERLADEVERAIASGCYQRAFGELLAPKLSMPAKIRRMLPWQLVRLLSKF